MHFRSTAARGKSGQAQCAAGQNTSMSLVFAGRESEY
jgi:hypothetical protein